VSWRRKAAFTSYINILWTFCYWVGLTLQGVVFNFFENREIERANFSAEKLAIGAIEDGLSCDQYLINTELRGDNDLCMKRIMPGE
jgi:hypothetical protein